MQASDSKVVIQITSNAAGVAPGVEQTETALGGLEPILVELNASILALTTQMTVGFTEGAASARQLAVSVEEAKVAAGHTEAGLVGMVMKIHEGAESIRTFQMRAKEFAEVYVAMFAVGEIASFINKMGEASEKVQHLAQQFGITTGDVQKLQGVALATGISVDALTRGMGLLDKNLATAEGGSKKMKSTMDQLGISFNDGRDQMQKLMVVADKFKNMDDGPKKVALAMQLFGRSGKELIPILNLGSDGIAALNKKMSEYGVENEDAVAKGVALAESVNESKLGFQGLENVLTDALAPAFKDVVDSTNQMILGLIQSYQEGGAAKEALDALSGTVETAIRLFEGLGKILGAVSTAFYNMASVFDSDSSAVLGGDVPMNIGITKAAFLDLGHTIDAVTNAALIVLEELKLGVVEFGGSVMTQGRVIQDALTFNWGDIEADWTAGMNAIQQQVDDTTTKVLADAGKMSDALAAAGNRLTLQDVMRQPLWDGYTGIPAPKAGGNFDFDPSKGKKAKKPKDDLVQKLEEELELKKAAWEKEQLAQGTAEQYSLQSEADYWAQALARTDLSAKDKMAIEKKWITASQAIQRENFDQVLDGFKRELAEADKNSEAKLVILKREQAAIHKMYGDRSKEAVAADDAVYQAEKAAAEQRIVINEAAAARLAAIENDWVTQQERDAQLAVELGLETNAQLLTQERDFENQRYQIDLQALQLRKTLIDPARDPVGYQKICTQLETLERQHQAKLTEIDRQAVLQRTALERQGIQTISQGWAQNIAKLATLQQGFFTTLQGLYQTLQQTAAQAIEHILQKFIATEATKLIYGKATAASMIAAESAKAGAGGVASMAAAPFPLDLTAPAFGATMAAAAMGYQGLASAAGGDWRVRQGLYELHADEMVLPAWAAEPLRQMIGQGAAANFNAPAAANERHGDSPVHLHLHGQLIHNPTQLRQWFERNRSAVGAGVRQFVHEGGNIGANRR